MSPWRGAEETKAGGGRATARARRIAVLLFLLAPAANADFKIVYRSEDPPPMWIDSPSKAPDRPGRDRYLYFTGTSGDYGSRSEARENATQDGRAQIRDYLGIHGRSCRGRADVASGANGDMETATAAEMLTQLFSAGKIANSKAVDFYDERVCDESRKEEPRCHWRSQALVAWPKAEAARMLDLLSRYNSEKRHLKQVSGRLSSAKKALTGVRGRSPGIRRRVAKAFQAYRDGVNFYDSVGYLRLIRGADGHLLTAGSLAEPWKLDWKTEQEWIQQALDCSRPVPPGRLAEARRSFQCRYEVPKEALAVARRLIKEAGAARANYTEEQRLRKQADSLSRESKESQREVRRLRAELGY